MLKLKGIKKVPEYISLNQLLGIIKQTSCGNFQLSVNFAIAVMTAVLICK